MNIMGFLQIPFSEFALLLICAFVGAAGVAYTLSPFDDAVDHAAQYPATHMHPPKENLS